MAAPASESYDDATAHTRLREYMVFFTLTRLLTDTPLLAEGLRIHPWHVITKAGKKARLVIDLCANLTTSCGTSTSATPAWTTPWKPPFLGCWFG